VLGTLGELQRTIMNESTRIFGQNGSHITNQERPTLNQQVGKVSRQIGQ
jgi:hypothetical protein